MSVASEVRAAGFVIYRRISQSIEYLLLQTSYGSHHWTPPKGHVDPGENDLEAAIRETKEEAGLSDTDYTIHDFKKELKYRARNKPKTSIYMLAELKSPESKVTLSDEHQDYKWAPLAEAQQLAKFSEMASFLSECEAFINSRK